MKTLIFLFALTCLALLFSSCKKDDPELTKTDLLTLSPDADVLVWERLDKRENGAMSDADAVTLLVMLSDNYSTGTARSFASAFPPFTLC